MCRIDIRIDRETRRIGVNQTASCHPFRYNRTVIDTDHLHRITTELQALAGAGVDGLDPESLCEVALAARRLRELADHVEVHALGAFEPRPGTPKPPPG